MATAVRPLGYYTSWLHVVTDIPSTNGSINLYTWIGDWTQRNYGHRWTNESKKLNAILTIQPGSIIQAPFYSNEKLNENLNVNNIQAAIFIPTGAAGFRDFDRITIINKGKIIGSYAEREYGIGKARTENYFSGSGSFTPPVEISQYNIISRHAVTNIDAIESAGRGGDGGSQIASPVGCGGGGGGAGGRSARINVSVNAGVQITASIDRDSNSIYSQGSTVLTKASRGENGGRGATNSENYCQDWGFTALGVRICIGRFNNRHTAVRGGEGGLGGIDKMTNIRNGKRGGDGGVQGQIYDDSPCEDDLATGGDGGVGAGANGGKGGEAKTKCGINTDPTGGDPAWHYYWFTQRQLCGIAIKNRHTNIRVTNEGQIAGGYNDGQTIYAVYGANTSGAYSQNEFSWGTLYPTSPGITSTVI